MFEPTVPLFSLNAKILPPHHDEAAEKLTMSACASFAAQVGQREEHAQASF
jgi:hypothetical protein